MKDQEGSIFDMLDPPSSSGGRGAGGGGEPTEPSIPSTLGHFFCFACMHEYSHACILKETEDQRSC